MPGQLNEQSTTGHFARATSLRQSRTAEGRHVSISCGTSHLSPLSGSFLNTSRRTVTNGVTPAMSPRRIAVVGLLSTRSAPTQALSGQAKWSSTGVRSQEPVCTCHVTGRCHGCHLRIVHSNTAIANRMSGSPATGLGNSPASRHTPHHDAIREIGSINH